MIDHRLDHVVKAVDVVLRAGDFGVDPARGAIDRELIALLQIADRTVADRPDVLDAVDARICAGDGIPGMAGDPHAQLVGLVGDHRDQVGCDEFAELDAVVTILLFLLHDGAGGRGIGYLHVAAPGARAFGFELALARADGLSGGPDPRSADFAHLGAFFLRQSPRAVLLRFDLHAGGDAEMQIDLAPERFPMAVTIYKSGKDMLAVDDDDMAARRYLHLAAASHRLDAVAFDDDNGILDRRPAGAVDQRPALDHEVL